MPTGCTLEVAELHRVVALILFAALLNAAQLAAACAPFIEEHANSPSASFRTHTADAIQCEVAEEEYRRVVEHWLRNRPPGAAALFSLSLGRAERFPWISRHLADIALQSEDWRTRVARGSSGRQNAFVAAILSEPVFLRRLSVPFEESQYSVLSVSVEKVLVGPASKHFPAHRRSNAMVPFDAQVWLRLGPLRQGGNVSVSSELRGS